MSPARARGRHWRLGSVLSVLLGLACADDGAGQQSDALTFTGDGERVRYLLGWSWEGAVWDPSTGGYRFTSDEGVEVVLTGLWVGVGALELVPCEPEDPSATVALLRELLLPAHASADHVWVSDGTLVEEPTAVDAVAGRLIDFGGGTTTPGSAYCGLYQRSIVIQDGVSPDLLRQSLRATGSYLSPGESASQPFDVDIDLLVGSTGALASDDVGAALPGVTDVVVTYAGARLFDGVRPDELSARELAYELLRNAMASSSVSLRFPL